MQQKNKEEKCVWESHLGQEVSRLSSYAFQNERGFSVQIGVLGWREDKKKAEKETKCREVIAGAFCGCCII